MPVFMKCFDLLFVLMQCIVLILQNDFNVYQGHDALRFNIVYDLGVPVDDKFPIYVHEPSVFDFCPKVIIKFTQNWKDCFYKQCNVKMDDSFPIKYSIMPQWELDISDIIYIPENSKILKGWGILHDINTNAKINLRLYVCEKERIMIIIPSGNENKEARERYKHHDYAEGSDFFSWN